MSLYIIVIWSIIALIGSYFTIDIFNVFVKTKVFKTHYKILMYSGEYDFNVNFITCRHKLTGEAFKYPCSNIGRIRFINNEKAEYCGYYKWKKL